MKRFVSDERGGAEVAGMIFLVPLVFGVVLLFVFLGRQGAAAEGATHAAHVAAVAAAHQRDPASATTAAHQAAASTLAAAGTACAGGPSVSVTADRWAPGGVVTVDVSCDVATGDLGALARRPEPFEAARKPFWTSTEVSAHERDRRRSTLP
jgi:Flp pilus assembly protein TadG